MTETTKSETSIKTRIIQDSSFRPLLEPLLVLFNKASEKVLPGKEYSIAYSIPGGVYGYYKNHAATDKEIESIKKLLKATLY